MYPIFLTHPEVLDRKISDDSYQEKGFLINTSQASNIWSHFWLPCLKSGSDVPDIFPIIAKWILLVNMVNFFELAFLRIEKRMMPRLGKNTMFY